MSLDIKICGLSTQAALDAVIDGGATHAGFIFFPPSPRNVDVKDAALLRERARGRAKAVAVTVDADDATLDAIVRTMAPDMIQFHGAEPPARLAEARARYGLPVIKALAIAEAEDLRKIEPFVGVADRLLLDAKPPRGSRLPGGNGVSFDWTILAALDPGIDYMLSGGLNAGNIGDALAIANPPAIDISSGVERAPGVKDVALIEAFFRAVRAAPNASAA